MPHSRFPTLTLMFCNFPSLSCYVAQQADPPFHALIDTGALITGMSNKVVHVHFLSLHYALSVLGV
jgi:hypothetical protein